MEEDALPLDRVHARRDDHAGVPLRLRRGRQALPRGHDRAVVQRPLLQPGRLLRLRAVPLRLVRAGPADRPRALRGLVRRARRHPLPDPAPAPAHLPRPRDQPPEDPRGRGRGRDAQRAPVEGGDPRQQGPEQPVQQRRDRALDRQERPSTSTSAGRTRTRSSRTSASARPWRSRAIASEICHDIFLDRYRPDVEPDLPREQPGRPRSEAAALRPEGGRRAARRGRLEAQRRPRACARRRSRARSSRSSSRCSGRAPRRTSRPPLNQYKNDLLSIGVTDEPAVRSSGPRT